MEQTTTLRTHVYESSLKWRIENFLDYEACNITELSSQTVNFEEIDTEWSLKIHPKIDKMYYTDPDLHQKFFRFQLNIQDKDSKLPAKRLFKAEIKIDPFGHHLMSASNRHIVKSRGIYAEPDMVEPIVKVLDYQEIGHEMFFEEVFTFPEDKFYSYLDAGGMTIFVDVWMKTVEIINTIKDSHHHQ
ncbi:hypothetical protein ACKWTF_015554 [Chironomus riparius]